MKRFRLYRETRTRAGIRKVEVEWNGHTRTWSGVDAERAIDNAHRAGIYGELVALECDQDGRLASERASA